LTTVERAPATATGCVTVLPGASGIVTIVGGERVVVVTVFVTVLAALLVTVTVDRGVKAVGTCSVTVGAVVSVTVCCGTALPIFTRVVVVVTVCSRTRATLGSSLPPVAGAVTGTISILVVVILDTTVGTPCPAARLSPLLAALATKYPATSSPARTASPAPNLTVSEARFLHHQAQ
jgi:hypothetical protein